MAETCWRSVRGPFQNQQSNELYLTSRGSPPKVEWAGAGSKPTSWSTARNNFLIMPVNLIHGWMWLLWISWHMGFAGDRVTDPEPNGIVAEFLEEQSYFCFYSWDHSQWVRCLEAVLSPQWRKWTCTFITSNLDPEGPENALWSVHADAKLLLLRGVDVWGTSYSAIFLANNAV